MKHKNGAYLLFISTSKLKPEMLSTDWPNSHYIQLHDCLFVHSVVALLGAHILHAKKSNKTKQTVCCGRLCSPSAILLGNRV